MLPASCDEEDDAGSTNALNGYRAIGIFSPEEVMKDEKEDPSDRAGNK